MPTNSANITDTGMGPVAVRHVVMVLFPATKLLDVTGPLQVFHDAKAADGSDAYRVSLVSEHGGPVTTDTGVRLETRSFSGMADAAIDILLVSGGSSALVAAGSSGLQAWLKEVIPHVARYGSVCLGAFILARGGHLDGRRAVTHWAWCEQLAAQYPQVSVEPDAIYTVDGAVWTSAGVSAGIDMALGMVERDLGRVEALRLARSLVLYLKRPGGQSQFSASLERQTGSATGRFDRLDAWIRAHVTADLSVSRLAAQVAMSERTFARSYRAATGISPARAVEMMRVDLACEMLGGEQQGRDRPSIKQVAADTGFGTEERMRRAFQRQKGIAPSAWQAHFGERWSGD
ncbi:MAG: DJ-1/PfpI family protein [Minwuia sp.]|nr:DJ-1/PfpI family protein [Minwuia sp.]